MSSLGSDIRYGLRGLIQARGFTAAVIATLALGIGANTAIFSVVHGVLWKPLPYREPGRLVRIGHARPGTSTVGHTFSPQDFDDLDQSRPGLQSVAAYSFVPGLTGMNLVGDGEPLRLSTCFVSSAFFEVLGVPAEIGRVLRPDENTPGRDGAVVISAGLWARRFGNDPAVIGRVVTIDRRPFTIVGVMPGAFEFPSAGVEVWAPVSLIGEDSTPHRREV
ncbi:MAG TPA: ABC transporter permease, partial [Thermoanaerobaculia bacterium]